MIIIIIIIIILVIITPSGQLAGQGGLDICRDRRSNRQHAFSEQTINYSFNLCPVVLSSNITIIKKGWTNTENNKITARVTSDDDDLFIIFSPTTAPW